jgi:hypothetical protein
MERLDIGASLKSMRRFRPRLFQIDFERRSFLFHLFQKSKSLRGGATQGHARRAAPTGRRQMRSRRQKMN